MVTVCWPRTEEFNHALEVGVFYLREPLQHRQHGPRSRSRKRRRSTSSARQAAALTDSAGRQRGHGSGSHRSGRPRHHPALPVVAALAARHHPDRHDRLEHHPVRPGRRPSPRYVAETAELDAQSRRKDITLVRRDRSGVTIAGWIKMARQAMDDIPTLATMINSLLSFDVSAWPPSWFRCWPATARVRTLANPLDVGHRCAGLEHGHERRRWHPRRPDHRRPLRRRPQLHRHEPAHDPEAARSEGGQHGGDGTGTVGAMDYVFGAPGGYGMQSIWGLRITSNRAVPQATPLVGDSSGATLLMRQGVNVKTSDSDQDDFINNRVTILAECRAAFPVWRPSAFATWPTRLERRSLWHAELRRTRSFAR